MARMAELGVGFGLGEKKGSHPMPLNTRWSFKASRLLRKQAIGHMGEPHYWKGPGAFRLAVGDIIQEALLAASEQEHCDDDNGPAVAECQALSWGPWSPYNNPANYKHFIEEKTEVQRGEVIQPNL